MSRIIVRTKLYAGRQLKWQDGQFWTVNGDDEGTVYATQEEADEAIAANCERMLLENPLSAWGDPANYTTDAPRGVRKRASE